MLKIAHLYPELMNLYGDQGNIMVLKRRSEWYGIPLEVVPVGLGDEIPFPEIDMIVIGGGSDREQGLITKDLLRHASRLMQAVEGGLPFLGICGAYQLLGKEYVMSDGKTCPGLNLFPFHTKAAPDRLIGNIALECMIDGEKQTVVGFENHSGRTWLEDASLQPFGTVLTGCGNNGEDRTEGIRYHNLVATYLHGPLLPKNPKLADFFLKKMFERKGIAVTHQLNDELERFAHQQTLRKITQSS